GRGGEGVLRVRGTSLRVPLIVPGAVLELHERVDAAGKIVVTLDESQAMAAVTTFIAEHRLDSVAVAFLWSFANPVHELAVEKIVRRAAPELFLVRAARAPPRPGAV